MKHDALTKPWWLLPNRNVHPAWWVAVLAILLWFDYVSGPNPGAPVLYVVPAVLAAWYSGQSAALLVTISVPLVHVALLLLWWQPANWIALAVLTVARGTIITLLAVWFGRLAAHERALIKHAQTLEGLLHICFFCKSIRNTDGEWERLERFIATRTETQFSHGLCPDCQEKYYPDNREASLVVPQR